MFQEELKTKGSMQCFIHKREKATHLCSDLRCHNNPIMCQLCFEQNNHRNLHGSHESFINPIVEGIERLANIIKGQSSEVERIYNYTIGEKEYDGIIRNIEKGDLLYQEIQNRIKSLKTQVELQLDLLLKEFQKRILLEKQQFSKNIDIYQRTYMQNYEQIRAHSEELLQFQKGLKYYANANNLYLKITHQTKKKSLEWLISKKRILNTTTKIIDNAYYIPETKKMLQLLTTMNIDRLPVWIANQNSEEKPKQLGFWIKNTIQGWIKIPQLKLIEKTHQKNSPYSITAR